MSTHPIGTSGETLRKRWAFPAKGALHAPLIAAGDRLLAVTDGKVFAIDMFSTPPDGRLVGTSDNVAKQYWPYKLRAFYGGNPQVTAAGGLVYLMDGESEDDEADKLYALRLADGSPLQGWHPPTLNQVSSLSAVDGHLIAVHNDPVTGATLVSGYDAVTGAQKFGPVQTSAEAASRIAFGADAVCYVAGGKLNVVNVDFGDPRWPAPIAIAGNSPDTLDGSVAPLVSKDLKRIVVAGGSLHGIDLITGNVIWTLPPSTGRPADWFTPAVASPAATVAAATNNAGDVIAFRIADGHIEWQTRVNAPGAPSILNGAVFVPTDHNTQLARFDLANKGTSLGEPYNLPDLANNQPPIVSNGMLFLTDGFGGVVAWPYAEQAAALFNGTDAHIEIDADDRQFDFQLGDFTVEAWIRSSVGGEIISSYPTLVDADGPGHGFRLNLTSTGQIRVSVTNADGSTANRGRTAVTNATDGEWHHIALLRRNGTFVVLLDGTSLRVLLPRDGMGDTLSIHGQCGLTIGAYVSQKGGTYTDHFRGLIREVRIWDRALDVTTIGTNLTKELTGTEPRLRGLWPLGDVQDAGAVEPRNQVTRHRATATFVGAASVPTDLVMDDSLFPYLLHEAQPQWPYAGTWAARGKDVVEGVPAVSADGSVVAFTTNNAIFAVGAHDGSRMWSMDLSETASEPVADGGGFYVLTEEESVVYLDARTGKKTQLDAFAGMTRDPGIRLATPAVSPSCIAAAATDGTVLVQHRGTDTVSPISTGGTHLGTIERLAFGDGWLGVLSGPPTARQLSVMDPASLAFHGTVGVEGDAFCTVGDWVICSQNADARNADGTVSTASVVVKLDANRFALTPTLAASDTIRGRVTGVVASVHDDLLVAVNDAGEVYGLALGRLNTLWHLTLPARLLGASKVVNRPIIDTAGRIVCTTASGTLAVVDPDSGDLLGLYFTGRGAVDAPAMSAGTIYTGCFDSAPTDETADTDGALHSVVFGETMALRLNLDERGTPITGGTQHAVIDVETETATLHLLGVQESCIETWVNLPKGSPGGGIVGICPTTASGFDLNLWLDADGTLHYSSRARGHIWTGRQVTAATTLIDGKWHHVAVARSKPVAPALLGAPDRVLIYIDGALVDTVDDTAPGVPDSTLTGVRAFIGATAADDGTAANPFCGMIAEVRVWDTYLTSTEISSRMHLKLRGDEPDLLAYWNFDRQAVHDSARQGHDGALADQPPTVPVWWLTDLPFEQPSYPFITTAAKIESQAPGQPTSYRLTLKVCRADGSGMPNQDVHLWYVKHTNDDPPSIMVNHSTELDEVDADAEADDKMFVGTTASDGTLQLIVTSNVADHGPALDLWTAFMPANERFHVNVLIDNQTLARPTPPSLTAQTKLLQDYHYTAGNKIDHTRDRSTWRVVLRAQDPDTAPRPGEPITVWADSTATIEVRGQSYTANPENALSFAAESNGELTIVLSADGLTAPQLYARAGFMNRNDRIVIAPDQDAHATLHSMQPDDLLQKKHSNWQKGQTDGDKQQLISDDYAGQKGQIAAAIHNVTGTVKPADPNAPAQASKTGSAAAAKLRALRATPAVDDMQQPRGAPTADRVVLMRTVAGTPRPAPVNPDALRDALGDHLGFVLENHPETGFRYQTLPTQADVDRERGQATLMATPMVAISLGSFWDDIVDTATTVYDSVSKVVVSVAEKTVQVALAVMQDGVAGIVHIVVATVEDALNAVANFFKALACEVMKLIQFLRALFDWDAIIRTHNILHAAFTTTFDILHNTLANPAPFQKAIAALAGRPSITVPEGLDSLNASSSSAADQDKSGYGAQANSVQGKSMMQKATASDPRAIGTPDHDAPNPQTPDSGDPLESLLQGIPALATDILDLSPSDLAKRLEGLVAQGGDLGPEALAKTLGDSMVAMAEFIKWTSDAIDTEVDIPFVSELYKWITGSTLTVLDVVCLGMAVPVNLAYAVYVLVEGKDGEFPDDPVAQSLVAQMRHNAGLSQLMGAPQVHGGLGEAPPSTPIVPEVVFVLAKAVSIITDTYGDVLFTRKATTVSSLSAQQIAGSTAWYDLFQGAMGALALSLGTWISQKNFEARIAKVTGDRSGEFLPPYQELVIGLFGFLAALRAKKMAEAVLALLGRGGSSFFSAKTVFRLTASASLLGLVAVIWQIKDVAERRPKLEAFGNRTVSTEYTLFATRDIMNTVPVLFEWMYTADGFSKMRTWAQASTTSTYTAFTTIRTVSASAGLAVHSVAVFGFGD